MYNDKMTMLQNNDDTQMIHKKKQMLQKNDDDTQMIHKKTMMTHTNNNSTQKKQMLQNNDDDTQMIHKKTILGNQPNQPFGTTELGNQPNCTRDTTHHKKFGRPTLRHSSTAHVWICRNAIYRPYFILVLLFQGHFSTIVPRSLL